MIKNINLISNNCVHVHLLQIFRGPSFHNKIETQMFFTPYEAKFVRFIPMTWRNNIGLRVSILGCPVTTTTLGYEFQSTVKSIVKRN